MDFPGRRVKTNFIHAYLALGKPKLGKLAWLYTNFGNRGFPERWTGSENRGQNRLGKRPKVFKVHGRTVSSRHPMEKNTSLSHDNYEMAVRRLGGTGHRLLKKADIGRAYKDHWAIHLKGVHQKNPSNEGSTHGEMVASPFSKCEAGEDNQTPIVFDAPAM